MIRRGGRRSEVDQRDEYHHARGLVADMLDDDPIRFPDGHYNRAEHERLFREIADHFDAYGECVADGQQWPCQPYLDAPRWVRQCREAGLEPGHPMLTASGYDT